MEGGGETEPSTDWSYRLTVVGGQLPGRGTSPDRLSSRPGILMIASSVLIRNACFFLWRGGVAKLKLCDMKLKY